MLPARIKDQRRWITPEPLNVSPDLVGAPLATPGRRAVAILIDVALVGLLSGVSGAWLLGGLALVILQLRSRRGATSGPRLAVGWVGAVLIAVLALHELGSQWDNWQRRSRAGTAASVAPSAVAKNLAAADAADVALAADAIASAAADVAASAASHLSDAQRMAQRMAQLEVQLEIQLALARKAPSQAWENPLKHFIDDIGLGLGWGIVYFSLLPAWWGGQTVGKKLLRLRVVELTGKPLTVMRCLRRYGGYAAGMATGGLGFAQMLWDPNRQSIQDRTAHTAVIDLRAPRQVVPQAVAEADPSAPPDSPDSPDSPAPPDPP